MFLERCKDQAPETLEEAYAPRPNWMDAEMSEAMLSLIRRFRGDGTDRRAWGLTSMSWLVLLAEDTYESPWYVKFVALSRQEYFIRCLLPERDLPWSFLTGRADDEDTAVAMVLEAMERSGGWSAPKARPKRAWADPPLAGPPMQISPWPVPCDCAEIIEQLRCVPFPNPVQLSVNDGIVRLSQGGPTFVEFSDCSLSCWVPPEEAPWPGSQYEVDFRCTEEAVMLILAAMNLWPR